MKKEEYLQVLKHKLEEFIKDFKDKAPDKTIYNNKEFRAALENEIQSMLSTLQYINSFEELKNKEFDPIISTEYE